ncbi:MAG: efflux RND transporter periplasmic adaptor subunit [Thermodesulfobacteriota bacterium]
MFTSKNRKILLIFGTIIIAIGFALWWFNYRPVPLEGFAIGNGRLEANEVNIATKFHGRVKEILFDEGDKIQAGQIVARMDTSSLEAQLAESQASVVSAEKQRNNAVAIVAQRKSECDLARKNLSRSNKLYEKGIISLQELDKQTATYDVSESRCAAAEANVANAQAAIEAAIAHTDRIKSDINDSVLKSPISGRVQYRLAEPGEVLPAGGKIMTIINLSDVYMTVFLSSKDAGRLAIGALTRIVFDAAPEFAIPAKVYFISSKAQFTPKEVETLNERQKLVFRVKVRIVPEILNEYEPIVKIGVPGVAYIRLDPDVSWPEFLNNIPELPDELSR